MSPVGILCASVAGVLSVGVGPGGAALFEDIRVVPLPKQTYGYRGMPGSMVELKDGRLLLSYSRMTPEGQGDGSIAGKYSTDKGKTWGEEFILVPRPKPDGDDRYCHPSFLRLANGHILLSYIYVSGAKPLFGHNYYRRSTDEARSWGDQLIVTPHPGYNIIHNDKFVQLTTGRILAPLEHEFVNSADDHAGYISYTVFSDDNGYSWHESRNMVNMLPVEAQEPHGVELKDGRLMMLMRTYSGFVARAYSTDRGESWSEGKPVPELPLPPHSTSALNVKRVPSTGDLLLLRCKGGPADPPHRRTPFVSVISKDDGETWTLERAIMGDPEDDYGYPGLLFVGDLALICYHQRDGLHVARIGIDWFYGK
jgi:sialidase-1